MCQRVGRYCIMSAKSSSVKMVAQDRVKEGTVRVRYWVLVGQSAVRVEGEQLALAAPAPSRSRGSPRQPNYKRWSTAKMQALQPERRAKTPGPHLYEGLWGDRESGEVPHALGGFTFLLQHHTQQSDEKNSLSQTQQVKPEQNNPKFRTGNVLQGLSRTHLRHGWEQPASGLWGSLAQFSITQRGKMRLRLSAVSGDLAQAITLHCSCVPMGTGYL